MEPYLDKRRKGIAHTGVDVNASGSASVSDAGSDTDKELDFLNAEHDTDVIADAIAVPSPIPEASVRLSHHLPLPLHPHHRRIRNTLARISSAQPAATFRSCGHTTWAG